MRSPSIALCVVVGLFITGCGGSREKSVSQATTSSASHDATNHQQQATNDDGSVTSIEQPAPESPTRPPNLAAATPLEMDDVPIAPAPADLLPLPTLARPDEFDAPPLARTPRTASPSENELDPSPQPVGVEPTDVGPTESEPNVAPLQVPESVSSNSSNPLRLSGPLVAKPVERSPSIVSEVNPLRTDVVAPTRIGSPTPAVRAPTSGRDFLLNPEAANEVQLLSPPPAPIPAGAVPKSSPATEPPLNPALNLPTLEIDEPSQALPTDDAAMPDAMHNEDEVPTAEPQPVFDPIGHVDRTLSGLSSAVTSLFDDEGDHSVVKVFYGTDRQPVKAGTLAFFGRVRWAAWITSAAILALALFFTVRLFVRGVLNQQLAVVSTVISVVFAAWIAFRVFTPTSDIAPGTVKCLVPGSFEYGSERGELQMGICEVTIPKRHDPGKLEAPSILRLEVTEREEEHVILRSVKCLGESEFYKQLSERVDRSPRRDLFIFIHGYNVTFEDAARRTAQMAYDLKFEGAPIFYSWPSRGQLLDYTVDETNVAWTVPHLRKFLVEVSKKTDAQFINLIAHSMGNRAMTEALADLSRELRDQKKLFNEVVLAAPDIDADYFKSEIAPAITGAAKRLTMYASSRDQALVISKLVHGYPRAGDSDDGLIIVPGIDTIDVSNVDTSLLGHSYYGHSVVVRDLDALLRESRPPNTRNWLEPKILDSVTYWSLNESANTARGPIGPTR